MQRRSTFAVIAAAAAALFAAGRSAPASLTAFDSAAGTAYNDGWQNGDNGGTGWGGGWVLTGSGSAGHFAATSTENGDGLDNGNVGGVAGDGDVNTAGRAWGMFANSGQASTATRAFSGALNAGQGFEIDFDNGFIDNGSVVGFALQTPTGFDRFRVQFTGGQSAYTVTDASGTTATSVGYGDEGLHVKFELQGPDSYYVTLTRRDGTGHAFPGTLGGPAGGEIAQVVLFNNNSGFNASNNAYFNNIAVIPEPASIGLIGLGTLGLLGRRRRAN